jgi:hypothetical protein
MQPVGEVAWIIYNLDGWRLSKRIQDAKAHYFIYFLLDYFCWNYALETIINIVIIIIHVYDNFYTLYYNCIKQKH